MVVERPRLGWTVQWPACDLRLSGAPEAARDLVARALAAEKFRVTEHPELRVVSGVVGGMGREFLSELFDSGLFGLKSMRSGQIVAATTAPEWVSADAGYQFTLTLALTYYDDRQQMVGEYSHLLQWILTAFESAGVLVSVGEPYSAAMLPKGAPCRSAAARPRKF